MSKSVKLDQVNFAGGLPNEKDLIPAIIYLVAYVLSSPILYWRIINPQHRTKLLIYPTIFHTCRIIMLIIRIIMAKIDYGEGLFIAEFVFVSIGVFFLISTVISCWELQLESEIKKEDQPNWIKQLGRLLSLTIWASIATSVAGSSMISSALKHPDKLHVVTGLRRAGNLLSLAVVMIAICSTLYTQYRFKLSKRGTLFLCSIYLNVLIVSIYGVVRNFMSDPDSNVRGRAAFWIWQMVFEFIAFVMLVSVSLPKWFPGNGQKPREQDHKALDNTADGTV